MSELNSGDVKEKIRVQYDTAPYPATPIEDPMERTISSLILNSLATPYYVTYQKTTDTSGKIILNAGCGSAYNAL